MKAKQRSRPARDGADSALRQQRMEAYLDATQAAFHAAVARSAKLGPAANGVLVGPLASQRAAPPPGL
jgi:hypothetical protein